MLPNTLNTNEIKNSAGTEVEFQRVSTGPGSSEFAAIAETPSLPHRMSVKHSYTGAGGTRRRRSVIRFDKTVAGTDPNVAYATISAYTVADFPVGTLATDADMKHVIAELNSFMASLGASTTILYDGSGNGAQVLLTGGI
jgi:hypothetical protein